MRSRYKPKIPSLIIRLYISSVSGMAPPTLYPPLCNVMAHKPMTFACMSAIPLRRCSSPFRERRRRAASPLGLLRSPRRRPSISAPVGCTARAPHTRNLPDLCKRQLPAPAAVGRRWCSGQRTRAVIRARSPLMATGRRRRAPRHGHAESAIRSRAWLDSTLARIGPEWPIEPWIGPGAAEIRCLSCAKF